jgi:hypothetical protein
MDGDQLKTGDTIFVVTMILPLFKPQVVSIAVVLATGTGLGAIIAEVIDEHPFPLTVTE